MTDNFSSVCLDLYKQLFDSRDRGDFFTSCVSERLNYLSEINSKQMDKIVSDLGHYINNLDFGPTEFNRCNNYKKMKKNSIQSNLNYLFKIIKRYNKTVQSSTRVLHKYVKTGKFNEVHK